MKSPKTPAHLVQHLAKRLGSSSVPFGGKPSKKKQPALVTNLPDEPDSPTDANDDENSELMNSTPMPGLQPLMAASQNTPSSPTAAPVAKRKGFAGPKSVSPKKNVKMVKGNKIPSGFFG